MRRNRFRSIFSRMMFMQCMTVAVAVLLIGVVLAAVVYAGRIGEYGTQLNRYAQNARAAVASGGSNAENRLNGIAADNDLLVERIGTHNDVTAYFADARWESYASQPLSDTAYERIADSANPLGETIRHYYKRGDFPVLSVYSTALDTPDEGLLVVTGDLSPIRETFGNILLWTVLICAVTLIGSGVVSYYTSYRVINPFIEMNHAVSAIRAEIFRRGSRWRERTKRRSSAKASTKWRNSCADWKRRAGASSQMSATSSVLR